MKTSPFILLIFFFCVIFMPALYADEPAGAGMSKNLTAETDGIAVITVRAVTPDYEWSMTGTAPVLDALLDGKFFSNIILFAGKSPFDYRLLAGPVSKGPHRVEIHPTANRNSLYKYSIENITMDVAAADTAEYEAYRYSPLLYGREENDISDVLLIHWVEVSKKRGGGTDYKYSFLWSNEDGGTKTAALMSRYGRSVDIEHAITVSVDSAGAVTGESYQQIDHTFGKFQGKHEGLRPVLIDATKNNTFKDTGGASLLFSFAPELMSPLPDVRETMLDNNSWTYRIMAEELIKEHKIAKSGTGWDVTKSADPRQYVYVDLNVSPMLPDFKIDIGVRLKGSGLWHSSVHGIAELALNLMGWCRVAVPVGAIPTPDGIDAVRVRLLDGYAPNSLNRVNIPEIRRIVVLDNGYMPHVIPLNLTSRAMLTTAHRELIFNLPANAGK